MTSNAVPAPRQHTHVSTWLSIGDLFLTLAKSPLERFSFCSYLPQPDAHPDIYFAQPAISGLVGDFGIKLLENGTPPPLRSPSKQSSLYHLEEEWLRRIYEVPVEERLWCLGVLDSAFRAIKWHVQSSLGPDEVAPGPVKTSLKTLPTVVGDLLHIDKLKSCEPHGATFDGDGEVSDRRLAFNIVVHIHADSKLAQYFTADTGRDRKPDSAVKPESRSLFHPPQWPIGRHPSTWGYEVYSTPEWEGTLKEHSGAKEQMMVKHAAIKACDNALRRIHRGRAVILDRLEEDDEQIECAERIRHLLHHPGGMGLDLQGLSLPSPLSSRVSYRPSDLVSAKLLAQTNRRNDPTALVQQLDFTPTFALVRGPPQPKLPLRALALPNPRQSNARGLVSPPLVPSQKPTAASTGDFDSESDCSSSDDEATSECSTPRTLTPMTSPRTPTVPLSTFSDSKSSYLYSDDDDEASSECSTPRALTPGQEQSRYPAFDHPKYDRLPRASGPELVS